MAGMPGNMPGQRVPRPNLPPPQPKVPKVPAPSKPSVSVPSPSLPSGDVGTLLGWTGLGFGVIILYGAYKGVSVFGPDGIITNAITQGKLTHVVAGKVTTSGGQASKPSNVGKVANAVAGSKGIGSVQNYAEATATSGPMGAATNFGLSWLTKKAGSLLGPSIGGVATTIEKGASQGVHDVESGAKKVLGWIGL